MRRTDELGAAPPWKRDGMKLVVMRGGSTHPKGRGPKKRGGVRMKTKSMQIGNGFSNEEKNRSSTEIHDDGEWDGKEREKKE